MEMGRKGRKKKGRRRGEGMASPEQQDIKGTMLDQRGKKPLQWVTEDLVFAANQKQGEPAGYLHKEERRA